MGFLYMLEFASGKKYIGITAHSVNERMHAHRSQALKLSKLSRNKVFSEETRKKMSDSAKASNAIERTKQPRKREKYVTVRIPDDVKEQLHQRADENTRTLAAQVLHYIKQGLAGEQQPH